MLHLVEITTCLVGFEIILPTLATNDMFEHISNSWKPANGRGILEDETVTRSLKGGRIGGSAPFQMYLHMSVHLTPFADEAVACTCENLGYGLSCPYLTGACESHLSAAFTGLAYCAYSHGIIELMQHPCVAVRIRKFVWVVDYF